MVSNEEQLYAELRQSEARIAELEKALREILATARTFAESANHCIVPREILGEARKLMESVPQ
jgi:hypothetical protein